MSGGAVVASGRAQRCADAEKRRVVHGELRRAVQAAIELVMHWAYGLQTGGAPGLWKLVQDFQSSSM